MLPVDKDCLDSSPIAGCLHNQMVKMAKLGSTQPSPHSQHVWTCSTNAVPGGCQFDLQNVSLCTIGPHTHCMCKASLRRGRYFVDQKGGLLVQHWWSRSGCIQELTALSHRPNLAHWACDPICLWHNSIWGHNLQFGNHCIRHITMALSTRTVAWRLQTLHV